MRGRERAKSREHRVEEGGNDDAKTAFFQRKRRKILVKWTLVVEKTRNHTRIETAQLSPTTLYFPRQLLSLQSIPFFLSSFSRHTHCRATLSVDGWEGGKEGIVPTNVFSHLLSVCITTFYFWPLSLTWTWTTGGQTQTHTLLISLCQTFGTRFSLNVRQEKMNSN